jgi:3-phenylpropionate/trans-cinnamate dioxygenase ferredoxin reductase subunit
VADIVIAGGGLAAVRTAQALRDAGFAGSLLMLSDEDEAPYDRPPLSKAFLAGTALASDIRLLAPDKMASLQLQLRLGAGAAGIDTANHEVLLAGGERVRYGRLVVATGARPMPAPSLAQHPAVHMLRSLDDARRLQKSLASARHVAVVGGGLIGLEIAAASIQRGAAVTVIEAAEVPLAPVVGPVLGRLIQTWHESKGIRFHCGVSATGIEGQESDCRLLLGNGAALAADLVVVGIGTIANTEWLRESGLQHARGLVVDDEGRSSDPDVFGVGDATCRMVGGMARPSRQWTATTELARRAAKALCGCRDQPPLIWDNYFWSDQHGLRLQYAGTAMPDARLSFVAGGPASETFVAALEADGRVAAVFSLGLPREFLAHSSALRRGGVAAR